MSDIDTSWRLLVIGCGSAGRRWIELGMELGLSVYAYDIDREARQEATKLGALVVPDVAAGLRRHPHGMLIATWPRDHVELALRAVRAGVHVLIEKPLSHTLEGVDVLVRECAERPDLAAGVVCNLRFHPAAQTLKKALAEGRHGRVIGLRFECGSDLKRWRPSPYELGYGPWIRRGGGVSLDAIHELDLACHLLGPPHEVVGLAWRTGELAGDSDDIANYLMRHPKKVGSEIHLDYLQAASYRRATIIGIRGRSEVVFDQDPKTWRGTYIANLRAWMAAAAGSPMPNPVAEAARTLRIALTVRPAKAVA